MPVANIIAFELPLPPSLPTIEGNVDYRDLRDQLLRINGLLVQSELEAQMLEADLQRWVGRAEARQRQGPTIQEDFRWLRGWSLHGSGTCAWQTAVHAALAMTRKRKTAWNNSVHKLLQVKGFAADEVFATHKGGR